MIVFAKRMWRKYVLPNIAIRQLRSNDYTSAHISGFQLWGLRVLGEESLKAKNLCRRVERKLNNALRLNATIHRDENNKLVGVTLTPG